MHTFFTLLTLYGAFTVLFGLISLFIKERLYISETVVSTLFGVIIGVKGLDVLHYNSSDANNSTLSGNFFTSESTLLFYLSRLVISLQVVAVGSIVPFNFIKSNFKLILILILPIMLLTYTISTVIIHFLLNLPLQFALVLAACVTPTDPVLASSILKGKFANRYIPKHLRNLLIVEGGINDGLAYPLLTLPLFYTIFCHKNGSASENSATSLISHTIFKWLSFTWCYEIIFACFYGLLIGFVFKKCLIQSKKWNLIDKENDLSYLLGLSLFVTGTTGLLKSDDILASFFCGISYSYVTCNQNEKLQTEKEKCVKKRKEMERFIQNNFEKDIESDVEPFEEYDLNCDNDNNNYNDLDNMDNINNTSNNINNNQNNYNDLNNYNNENDHNGDRLNNFENENLFLEHNTQDIATSNNLYNHTNSYSETHYNMNYNNNIHNLNNQQSDHKHQNDHHNHSNFYEILDILINAMFFMLFGYFLNVSGKFVLVSFLLLLLKRLPLFLVVPILKNKRESFFAGWYGPVGVGALFFFSHYKHEVLEGIPHFKKNESLRSSSGDDILGESNWFGRISSTFSSNSSPATLLSTISYMETFINSVVLLSVLVHGTTAVVINLALRKKKKSKELMYVSESEVSGDTGY